MSNSPVTESEIKSSNLDVGEFMQMMDVADLIRRQDRAVQEQLSLDDQKKSLASKMRETYKAMGAEVSDEQMRRAIEDHFSKKWEFDAPEAGLSTRLAGLYVARRWIGTRIVIPTMAVVALAGIGRAGMNAVENARFRSLEQRVENSVENSYREKINLENSVSEVVSSYYVSQLPGNERGDFDLNIEIAKSRLGTTGEFFENFTADGEADDKVTLENYEQVSEKVNVVRGSLDSVKENLGSARNILEAQERYVAIASSLDNLIGQIRNVNPQKPLLIKAEGYYTEGTQSIRNRQLTSAETAVDNLSGVLKDSREFGSLTSDLGKLYNQGIRIAIEDQAKEDIEKIKRNADAYIQTADVENLRKSAERLRELNGVLEQEYSIEVIQKNGYRSGLWRHSDDMPSRNNNDEDPQGKVFYLVVRAVDENGREISQKLRNEEDGVVENVFIWGEKVPHEVYLRLKKDKMDNGLLDDRNNIYFGEKKKGYLGTTQTMTDNRGRVLERQGQITREENNWRRP